MGKATKARASKLKYISQNQMILPGFETPFEQNLNPTNRWVTLARNIPWDKLVRIYESKVGSSNYGAGRINSRIVIGSLIIKYLNNLSDRDVVQQIQENLYMQYFLGLSSFCSEPLFDASLLVEFRNRLGVEEMNLINETVVKYWGNKEETTEDIKSDCDDNAPKPPSNEEVPLKVKEELQGSLIIDATAVPQDIAYPTDINLLSDSREVLEGIIDTLHEMESNTKKPRTYREKARKEYLKVAQNRNPSKKTIRTGVKKQLQYVSRNLRIINRWLDHRGLSGTITAKEHRYLLIITHLHDQQMKMYKEKSHSISDRIVSIHQPHVRPIVRGKRGSKVEFGAKIQVGLSNGLCYLDHLSWDAYNEGQLLEKSVEEYKRRTGKYPQEVLADKIYCSRVNREWLKEKGILLKAKPLGRPKAVPNHVRPGERNPIEGKFGQAKTAYGMQRLKARLAHTSSSWIAGIILVLNLVKLAGLSAYCIYLTLLKAIYKVVEIVQVKPKYCYTMA